MNQGASAEADDELRPEYDLSGVRGTYYGRYRQGTSVVLADPDVAAVSRDSESVNAAPRLLIGPARGQVRTRT